MKKSMVTSWLRALALGAVVSALGFAQQPTNDDLKKEIGVLQQAVQGMQKDLQEIKAMLAGRPSGSPSPVGTEIDISAGRLPGDPAAKLELGQVSAYQWRVCVRYM